MLIGVCPGHSLQWPGATFGGLSEAWLNRVVVNAMGFMRSSEFVVVDAHSDERVHLSPSTRDAMAAAGNTFGADRKIQERYLRDRVRRWRDARVHSVVDLHLNSHRAVRDGHADYTEMLYFRGSAGGRRLAEILGGRLRDEMADIIGSPRRLVIREGGQYVLRAPGFYSVIAEPFFLSHPAWRERLIEDHATICGRLAAAYVAGLREYAESFGG